MKILDNLSQTIGRLVAWLTLLMIGFSLFNILSSWLFNSNSIAIQESITWMHGFNFLLATAYTLNSNEHVRVDIFYAKMKEHNKALVDLIGSVFLLAPTAIFIVWASWPAFYLSWRVGESSSEPGGLPMLFILKALLLIMPLFLLIETINQIIKNLNIIKKQPLGKESNSTQSGSL
ncbi:MAG: TRAP-type mannitol/chloroaromatic compound transport system permease small subunit [Polaribacter sp.]|jgi:TRAP-type mannitol/chloroaromatic compound transport system permease small subunit